MKRPAAVKAVMTRNDSTDRVAMYSRQKTSRNALCAAPANSGRFCDRWFISWATVANN